MPATVLRHVMEPALLPGATGQVDLRAAARAAVVASLREALADVAAPAPREQTAPCAVLVVAPARRSLRTTDGRADLGALGLPETGDPAAALAGDLEPAPAPGTHRGPSLDVVASVAVTLLAAAGWRGPVETVERGAPDGGTDLDELLLGRSLVLVALAADDALLPAGAPADLAAGQAEVWSLAERWLC